MDTLPKLCNGYQFTMHLMRGRTSPEPLIENTDGHTNMMFCSAYNESNSITGIIVCGKWVLDEIDYGFKWAPIFSKVHNTFTMKKDNRWKIQHTYMFWKTGDSFSQRYITLKSTFNPTDSGYSYKYEKIEPSDAKNQEVLRRDAIFAQN